MKPVLLSLTFLLVEAFTVPAFANTSGPSVAEAYSPAVQHSLPGNLTQDELLNLKPKEIAARAGKKMNFFQRMAVRVVQKKLKKQKARQQKNGLKNDPTFSGKTSFWLGISAFATIPLSILTAVIGLYTLSTLIIIALPALGILAFVFGKIAKGKGDQSQAAKTGLSIGTFFAVIFGIALGLFLIAALLFVVAGEISW